MIYHLHFMKWQKKQQQQQQQQKKSEKLPKHLTQTIEQSCEVCLCESQRMGS